MPAAPISQPAMAVGMGAPPVYSDILELELIPGPVPPENVVVRVEERADAGGGGVVPDEVSVPLSIVLDPSKVASGVEDVSEPDADEAGADNEDAGTEDGEAGAMEDDAGTGTAEEDAEPAEESAALLGGDMTIVEGTAELPGAED